jgi:hypothetical protein
LEPLEDRRLLTGTSWLPATPNVTYHGGPLLQNVQVQNVFYGQPWTTDTTLKQAVSQTDTFLNYFVTSPYMDVLHQYNVNHGSVAGMDDVINQNPAGSTIDDSTIRQILNTEIGAHNVVAPGSNQLYIFYTAPGVVVTANGESSARNFAGYHDVFTDTAGAAVYYAVIPYPSGGVANVPLTTFQQETVVLSHEIAEAVTDPDTQTGWFDPVNGEIGDIADGQVGLLNGFAVSAVWSQSAGQVVVPAPASATTGTAVDVSGVRVQALVGQPFTTIVATLTDTPAGATTGSYTATIDWGNGTTSTGTLTVDPNGGFDITGTNTYAAAGSFPVTVTVDDSTSTVVGTALTTATVSAGASTIHATGTTISATPGQSFTGTVANFTDSAAGTTAGSYTATINWGDGTTSTGTVTGTAGSFVVGGPHTYTTSAPGKWDNPWWNGPVSVAGPQDFVVTVTINSSIAAAKALSLATVTAPAPAIMGMGENIAAVSGQSFTGLVATFTTTIAGAAAGDFTATINWGNGTTSTGTVQASPAGGFEVVGTTTYSTATDWFGFGYGRGGWSFLVSVSITDTKTSDQARTVSKATVLPTSQNLLVAAQNIQATAGQSFSGVVAVFHDNNSALTGGSFTATINWGDGTTSTGTVAADANGGFDVTGMHTYAAVSQASSFWGWHVGPFGPGKFLLSATVTGPTASDSGTSTATATVTPPVANAHTAPVVFSAVFGQSFTGTVATFTTPLAVTGWTATINWGDGTTTSGTIVADPHGGFDVTGTHTYGGGWLGGWHISGGNGPSGPVPFLVSVTLNNPTDGSTASVVSLASVTAAPPKIVAAGVNLNLAVSNAFTGTVATFTDADAAGTTNFHVVVSWGDGTFSLGSVAANPSGGFLVGGTHTYRRGGSYAVFVRITDADGNSAVSVGTAIVSDNTPVSLLNTVACDLLQSAEHQTQVVLQNYSQYLNRTPSGAELAGWVAALQQGWTDAQVQAAFAGSAEFYADAGGTAAGWLNALYLHVLGRGADTGGLAAWSGVLARGGSLAQIAQAFVNSAEHEAILVQTYYQTYLGRRANAAEVGSWVNANQAGLGNSQIIADFLASQEFFNSHNANATDWLTAAYQSVLSRRPDQAGLSGWLTVLGQ